MADARMRGGGATAAIVGLVVVLILIGGLVYVYSTHGLLNSLTSTLPTSASTTIGQNATTTVQQAGNQSYYETYVLSLINNDRNQYGFSNVTLSNEPSLMKRASLS